MFSTRALSAGAPCYSNGTVVSTANSHESRPALSLVKLYLAFWVLQHGAPAATARVENMIREFTRVLRAWADDDAVRLVLVRGAGERGIGAGGLAHRTQRGETNLKDVLDKAETDEIIGKTKVPALLELQPLSRARFCHLARTDFWQS